MSPIHQCDPAPPSPTFRESLRVMRTPAWRRYAWACILRGSMPSTHAVLLPSLTGSQAIPTRSGLLPRGMAFGGQRHASTTCTQGYRRHGNPARTNPGAAIVIEAGAAVEGT